MAYTLVPIHAHEISEGLYTGWGIGAESINQLYLGTGGDTGIFRADATRSKYFLKLAKKVSETGIAVSLLLADRGVPAVAPILSSTGNAWEMVAGYRMVVYPFIHGSPIVPEAMTALDWRSVGIALRAVHDTPLPAALRDSLPLDGLMFRPWGEVFLRSVRPALSSLGGQADLFQQELAKLWFQQGNFPEEFLSLVQVQGEAALATSPVCGLCHNDFQSQNILKSSSGTIHLIDWEGAMWAPPEKDLMFIQPEYRAQFEKGYGPLHLNKPVMGYQAANWLLQDLFDCVDRILFKGARRPEEKQWALDLTRSILLRMRAVARTKA